MLDLLIQDVQIIDGTGREPYQASIGILDGKIASLGATDAGALRTIEGRGLVATPGFIDMHSHTDLEYFRDTPPGAKVRQGITTELLAQDGLGVAPIDDANQELLAQLTAGLLGTLDKPWSWRTFDDYLVALERRGLPNNAAVLASHGPLRILALGMEDRPATEHELATMCQMAQETMDCGAFGLSTGLIYPPCSYAPTEELVALNSVVAAAGGVFVVHQRDEGYLMQRAFDEVLHVSRQSGVHLHVSHLQAYGQVNWPTMDGILDKAEAFLREGGQVTWDRYPYLAGCTVLSAVLPPWTFQQGTKVLAQNLTDPAFRDRIRQDFTKGLDVWNNRSISVGWEKIVVSAVASEANRWMEGRDCADLAQSQGKDPIDFVCDLLAEENLAVTMISFYGSDHVLEKVLNHPQSTVGSDGIFGGRPHPRLYGTYPRFLKQFVRDKQHLTWPQAINKITSFPASILGLQDRGRLEEGCWADVVLLDPETITDKATYEQPEQAPMGLPFVVVNGKVVVDGGEFTGRLAGSVLRS